MGYERSTSQVEPQKEPHSITLRVLRLLRPLLNQQYPLPPPDICSDDNPEYSLHEESLAYPSSTDNQFILSPLLTLPPAFGNAYIGENFSCCLSAINETQFPVTNVLISAEIQTPSSSQPLELFTSEEIKDLSPKQATQSIAKYDLKEEGTHVLAVTVTYTEMKKKQEEGSGTRIIQEKSLSNEEKEPGKVRTFRKLYQFIAQHRMTVKTKAGELPNGKAVMEAQLENSGDGPICLEKVYLTPRKGWKTTSLNWDRNAQEDGARSTPLLRSREIMQVAFLLHPDPTVKRDDDPSLERIVLGQLSIEWRSSCGERGFLSTGYLTAKRLRP